MRRLLESLPRVVLTSAFLVSVAFISPSWAIEVDETTDVCPDDEDPCLVTVEADVVDGTTLDFGLRTVSLSGAGRFDFNSGSGSILCGEMTASVGNNFLKARGSVDGGAAEGGVVRITARRGCSDAPTTPCLRDTDCPNGTCSVGAGTMSLDGGIFGSGVEPGTVLLRGVGDLSIEKSVNMIGSGADSDGGEFEMLSTKGSITVNGAITVSSGLDSEGGIVSLDAEGDIALNQPIDATGGDFDGGTVDIVTRGNYRQGPVSINASATRAAGTGGVVFIQTGGELRIDTGSDTARLRIVTNGSTLDDFGGDGGEQELDAGGDLLIPEFTRFESDGARPDGGGGDYFFTAGGKIEIFGQVHSKSLGGDGGGGQVTVKSGGSIALGDSTGFDFSGGSFGAGLVEMDSGEGFFGAGLIDMTATGGGAGGGIDILSRDGLIDLTGTMRTVGDFGSGADGEILVRGCRVTVASGASFDNRSVSGENVIEVRENLTVESGASIRATATDGSNIFRHRSEDKPPTIIGVVDPAPSISVFPSLTDCPLCGNGEIERGETCDDGNVVSGDGCSDTCVDEDCIADTPGFPSVALCDDLDACTVDACEDSGCVYSALCDDGIACTTDSCDDGTCMNQPVDSVCDDANACTNDFCIEAAGCTSVNNTDACDDGAFCTVEDTCSSGLCLGTTRDCGDGVSCTADSCSEGADTCVNVADDGLCDDGAFCNGVETCDATEDCQAGTDIDCSELDDVCLGGVCDDGLDTCVEEAINDDGACDDGVASTENDRCVNGFCLGDDVDCNDGIPCTVDRFDDDLGRCVSTPDDAVCDDRQFCNGVEACDVSAGCVAGESIDCSELDALCLAGACDELRDRCGTVPADEGVACDDGMFCTLEDSCRSGVCTGDERDCSDGIDCTLDGCNDTVDECRNIVQDERCDDGLFCNGLETCSATEDCVAGEVVDCSSLDRDCEAGACLEDFDVCGREIANEGVGCDDGDVCTDSDRCQTGICIGDEIVDCGICGNGMLDEGETCDDGDALFEFGEACDATCMLVGCARPTNSTGPRPSASDALFILRAAVALVSCDVTVCDPGGDGFIRASDALLTLNAAVGRDVVLACPSAN